MEIGQIITLVCNIVLALTSLITCIIACMAKKDARKSERNVNETKIEIQNMMKNFKIEQNSNSGNLKNTGEISGVMAGAVMGGVNTKDGK